MCACISMGSKEGRENRQAVLGVSRKPPGVNLIKLFTLVIYKCSHPGKGGGGYLG